MSTIAGVGPRAVVGLYAPEAPGSRLERGSERGFGCLLPTVASSIFSGVLEERLELRQWLPESPGRLEEQRLPLRLPALHLERPGVLQGLESAEFEAHQAPAARRFRRLPEVLFRLRAGG